MFWAAKSSIRIDGYDPRLDPIVRVEARRLRSKLEEYYSGPGHAEQIRIEYPKGGYLPVFTRVKTRFHAMASGIAGSYWHARPLLRVAYCGERLSLCRANRYQWHDRGNAPGVGVEPYAGDYSRPTPICHKQ